MSLFLNITLSLFASASSLASATDAATMTIRVLDQANLTAKQIQKMERYVEATFTAAQIRVTWVDCKAKLTACKTDRAPNEFWLRILAQMPPAVDGGIDVLGFTQHGDAPGDAIQCVNVFHAMVEKIAERERTDIHVVLGAAVVHEIGHLYLGTNKEAHSESGVMRGAWSHREFELASIGELNFTREQGARIRTKLEEALKQSSKSE